MRPMIPSRLTPCRIAAVGFRVHKVLELPVGAIRASRTRINDQLVVQEPGSFREEASGAGEVEARAGLRIVP